MRDRTPIRLLRVCLMLGFLCPVLYAQPPAFTADQKRRAEQLTSLFENDTLDLQYGHCAALRDGRGYTAGRADLHGAPSGNPLVRETSDKVGARPPPGWTRRSGRSLLYRSLVFEAIAQAGNYSLNGTIVVESRNHEAAIP